MKNGYIIRFVYCFLIGICNHAYSLFGQVTVPKTPFELKTLSYNIHHGTPDSSNRVDLSQIAAVIKQSGAHLVALQEVDQKVPRSNLQYQLDELLHLLEWKYGYFSKSIDLSGGHYGVAILSQFPILESTQLLLPSPIKSEQRSVAFSKIELPLNDTIWFASTHFDLNQTNRLAQSDALSKHPLVLDAPLLIGGDFNAAPDAPELRPLYIGMSNTSSAFGPATFPVRQPVRVIDHFFYNDSFRLRFTPKQIEVNRQALASDHLPILTTWQYIH
jgi:endonuclease/exonuclease/phosphatase family metal-dependent hydrolase